MGRLLSELRPDFGHIVNIFLARLVEARIPVIIVDTGRTAEEQAEKIRLGLSWTSHSKHQDGLAIDVCPYSIYDLHGADKLQWDESDPIWQQIGDIGKECGLKWGVTIKGIHKDLGHFEFIEED